MTDSRDDFDATADQGDLFDPTARLKLDLNDVDNALRIHQRLRDDAVYVEGVGWMVWDGARFNAIAGEERMKRLVGDVLRPMIEEEAAAMSRQPVPEGQLRQWMAEHGETDEEAAARKIRASRSKSRRDYAKSCGNIARIKAAMEAARGLFLVEMSDLNTNRDLFQVPNGTIQLNVIAEVPEAEDPEEKLERWRRSLIDPHDRKARPTRVGGCKFDPAARAPEWERFIELIMPDPDMREYLQIMMGQTLFGQEGERMIVLLGQGGNGKSTLIKGLRNVWGSYAESCRIEMFCEQRGGPGNGPTPEEAVLPFARTYLASEPDVSVTISAAKAKGLTGGDERQANPKNKALFTYTPVGIPILQANKMMNVNDPSRGFWRRVYPVLFEVSLSELPVPDQRTSSQVDRIMLSEAPGILNWLLDGYAIYRIDGIRIPQKASALKESLQSLADPVGEFLRERTQNGSGARVATAGLYKVFKEWAEAQGSKPMSNKAFTSQMLAMDYKRIKTGGNWYWLGLDLIDLIDEPGGTY